MFCVCESFETSLMVNDTFHPLVNVNNWSSDVSCVYIYIRILNLLCLLIYCFIAFKLLFCITYFVLHYSYMNGCIGLYM